METKLQEEVGRVTHYYPKISVAVVELKEPLTVGDRIVIIGRTTRIEQVVDSIQIEHDSIKSAKPGQSVGVRVVDRVRESDVVYKTRNQP